MLSRVPFVAPSPSDPFLSIEKTKTKTHATFFCMTSGGIKKTMTSRSQGMLGKNAVGGNNPRFIHHIIVKKK